MYVSEKEIMIKEMQLKFFIWFLKTYCQIIIVLAFLMDDFELQYESSLM